MGGRTFLGGGETIIISYQYKGTLQKSHRITQELGEAWGFAKH